MTAVTRPFAFVLLLGTFAAGCVVGGLIVSRSRAAADPNPDKGGEEQQAELGSTAQPAEAAFCVWKSDVQVTADPTQGGRTVHGVAGRLYLRDADGRTVVEAGKMSFFLYDDSGPEPVLTEVWNFDEETTAKVVRTDELGSGYTIFLPTRNPLPKKVVVRAAWIPADGRPPMDAENRVTLGTADGTASESGRR